VSTANPVKTITRGYDSLGRLTSYRDAEGVTSTITSYDVRDRVVTSSDAKGTQTRTYDALRGLATVSAIRRAARSPLLTTRTVT
jgi:YD repeat-containing protein